MVPELNVVKWFQFGLVQAPKLLGWVLENILLWGKITGLWNSSYIKYITSVKVWLRFHPHQPPPTLSALHTIDMGHFAKGDGVPPLKSPTAARGCRQTLNLNYGS